MRTEGAIGSVTARPARIPGSPGWSEWSWMAWRPTRWREAVARLRGDPPAGGGGEAVPCATVGSARWTEQTRDRTVDAVMMAIVDQCHVDGRAVHLG
jgi:hypothetical protein